MASLRLVEPLSAPSVRVPKSPWEISTLPTKVVVAAATRTASLVKIMAGSEAPESRVHVNPLPLPQVVVATSVLSKLI